MTGLSKYIPTTNYEQFRNNHVLGTTTVLPTISDDLKRGAMTATIFSIMIICLYIFHPFPRLALLPGNHRSLVARRVGNTSGVLVPEEHCAFPAGTGSALYCGGTDGNWFLYERYGDCI
jgi:hypothetical protein